MMVDLETERASLIALLHPPQPFEWAPLRSSLLEDEVWPSHILKGRVRDGLISDFEEAVELARARILRWELDGTRFLTYLDPEYPRQLREVHDLPPFVFARGTLGPTGVRERGISIVGSRDASPRATNDAAELAKHLVAEGIPVVSGLAAGIDAAAHKAALDLGGRTVGIIGTGIDRYYPKSSEPLQRRMEAGEGLVLSQFWPGSGPTRISFPMRNTVMSAFSMATVIVQASEKSGTKHQARSAIAHGRPIIITDTVASTTTWGRKLAEGRLLDVTVVSTLEEAVCAAIDKSQPTQVVQPSSVEMAAAW